jgi:hypothetical protein
MNSVKLTDGAALSVLNLCLHKIRGLKLEIFEHSMFEEAIRRAAQGGYSKDLESLQNGYAERFPTKDPIHYALRQPSDKTPVLEMSSERTCVFDLTEYMGCLIMKCQFCGSVALREQHTGEPCPVCLTSIFT